MSDQETKRLYLEDVHLIDYKSIDDLYVDFKRDLNILIGRNGAGKSNLLEAIIQALKLRPVVRRFPFKAFTANFSTSEEDNLRYEIAKVKRSNIKDNEDGYDQDYVQQLYIEDKLVFDSLVSIADVAKMKLVPNLRMAFRRAGLFYLNPVYVRYSIPEEITCITEAGQIKIPLAEPDMIEVPFGMMAVSDAFDTLEHGVMEAGIEPLSINKEYLLEHIVADENLVDNLRKFTPIQGFKLNENINIYNDGKELIIENLKFDFLINGNWMPWSYLSDGTRRLFYLVAEVTVADGRLILIEEPELGVHPHQFNLVMHFLKEQSKYAQIIISTHSPAALNHLEQDELDRVLIAYTTRGKGTQVKRMEASQKETAIQYMTEVGSLSDYWLMSDLEE